MKTGSKSSRRGKKYVWLVLCIWWGRGQELQAFFIQSEINGVFFLSLTKHVKAVAFQIIDPSHGACGGCVPNLACCKGSVNGKSSYSHIGRHTKKI